MLRILGVSMIVLFGGLGAAAQESVPVPPGLPRPELVVRPDLVIAKVDYRLFQAWQQPPNDAQLWLWITVKNVGGWGAGGSKLAVLVITDTTGANPVLLFAQKDVPSIPAGGETEVALVPVGSWEALKNGCCLILVVDAPVKDKPLGQISEGAKGEKNNGFVVFLPTSYEKKTLTNPALAEDGVFLPLNLPDLVVAEVDFKIEPGHGDFRLHKFSVGVKNIGPGQADISRVAVFILSDVMSTNPVFLFGVSTTSGLGPGTGLKVLVSRWLSADLRQCCVIAVTDAPVTGKPLGQLQEKNERNNGFVFFLTPSYELQSFANPAFEK